MEKILPKTYQGKHTATYQRKNTTKYIKRVPAEYKKDKIAIIMTIVLGLVTSTSIFSVLLYFIAKAGISLEAFVAVALVLGWVCLSLAGCVTEYIEARIVNKK